jgi:hypothetical protein
MRFDCALPLPTIPRGSFISQPKRRDTFMPKFLSTHSLPGGVSREQIKEFAQAAKNDPVVKPYRSFLNLSEGRVCCIMEAPTKDALASWFNRMQIPYDYISVVELEGVSGSIMDPATIS